MKAEQGLTTVEPDSKEPTRLWLVTNVDVLQRGEMLGVIREQTQLEFALEAVNANQRPQRQANLLERGGGIRPGAVNETLPT